MNVMITILKVAGLFVAVMLLVSSFIRLYRWRKSAFDSTDAYLRNLRYIQPGEKVCIQAPDEPGMQYVSNGKSSKTMVYWEYWYTVEGTQYCRSYFYEDDEDQLPSRIRVHYNRKNPEIMYQEGGVRDGVVVSVVSILLGGISLLAAIASYIWK